MKETAPGSGIVILVILLSFTVMVLALPAAGQDPDHERFMVNTPPVIAVNQTAVNESALDPYRKPPEPVTVFRAEVSETSLPGPRYMAYGPSVIGLSLSPEIFSALVAILSGLIAGWCIVTIGRWGEERRV